MMENPVETIEAEAVCELDLSTEEEVMVSQGCIDEEKKGLPLNLDIEEYWEDELYPRNTLRHATDEVDPSDAGNVDVVDISDAEGEVVSDAEDQVSSDAEDEVVSDAGDEDEISENEDDNEIHDQANQINFTSFSEKLPT